MSDAVSTPVSCSPAVTFQTALDNSFRRSVEPVDRRHCPEPNLTRNKPRCRLQPESISNLENRLLADQEQSRLPKRYIQNIRQKGVPTKFSKENMVFELRQQQIALLLEHVEEANSHRIMVPSAESVLPRQTIIGIDGPVSAPCCKKIQVVFE